MIILIKNTERMHWMVISTGKSWVLSVTSEMNYQNEFVQKLTSNNLVVRKLV
jgi:hypothetical protein